MFKSVEFTEVEGDPVLLAKARRATDALGSVIRAWRDEVDVRWHPAAPGSRAVLELTLALALWNAAGMARGAIRPRGFEPDKEESLRSDLREVWLDLLGELSRQQMKRLDEVLLEPVEA